ncbi:MAG: hydantoinase/oxoprolinase family protein, partial [Gammaproteobacteria bacterium]
AYTVLTPESAAAIDAVYRDMEDKLRRRLGLPADTAFTRSFDGQLLGQTWETPFVDVPPGPVTSESVSAMIANFHAEYEQRNGDRFEAIPVQGVTYRVRAEVPTPKVQFPELPARSGAPLAAIGATVLRYLSDDEQLAQIYERTSLRAGDVIDGPAIVREALSTTHIGRRQRATVGRLGEISIELK